MACQPIKCSCLLDSSGMMQAQSPYRGAAGAARPAGRLAAVHKAVAQQQQAVTHALAASCMSCGAVTTSTSSMPSVRLGHASSVPDTLARRSCDMPACSAVADDHSQQDEVWAPKPSEGRETLKKGISSFRNFFQDVRCCRRLPWPDCQERR